jgi:RNA binding exosome subunit
MSGKSSTSPYFDRFEARAFSRATEIPDRVKEALHNLFPEKVQENVVFSEERTEGHHKNPIHVMHVKLRGKRVKHLVNYLFSEMSHEDMMTLLDTLDSRLDESCNLFLRIDKQAAYLGKIELASLPDVISCQIHIRRYPKCTFKHAKSLLEQYSSSEGELSE